MGVIRRNRLCWACRAVGYVGPSCPLCAGHLFTRFCACVDSWPKIDKCPDCRGTELVGCLPLADGADPCALCCSTGIARCSKCDGRGVIPG